MTLILAIPCRDRVVIAADGRTTHFEAGKHLPDMLKIFELTPNSAILIAGECLIDDLSEYMDKLVQDVRARGNTNIVDIARDVKAIIDKREWAEWKDKLTKSHMEALVAGFDGGIPTVYSIGDSRDLTRCRAGVFGNWNNARQYILDHLSIEHSENTTKTGNKVATEMLTRAENANNTEIGGQCAIWHILPSHIRKLDASDIAKLQKRYGEKIRHEHS